MSELDSMVNGIRTFVGSDTKERVRRDVVEQLRELRIDLRNIPIKDIQTDLVPISQEGANNIETILRWERIKQKLKEVV